jgi:hypothetical protein
MFVVAFECIGGFVTKKETEKGPEKQTEALLFRCGETCSDVNV